MGCTESPLRHPIGLTVPGWCDSELHSILCIPSLYLKKEPESSALPHFPSFNRWLRSYSAQGKLSATGRLLPTIQTHRSALFSVNILLLISKDWILAPPPRALHRYLSGAFMAVIPAWASQGPQGTLHMLDSKNSRVTESNLWCYLVSITPSRAFSHPPVRYDLLNFPISCPEG